MDKDKLIKSYENSIIRMQLELEALRDILNWRPISAAPKDGTVVLLWCQGIERFQGHNRTYKEALTGYYDKKDGWIDDGAEAWGVPAVAWMPLPPAPK
jgi:hypothetical protein